MDELRGDLASLCASGEESSSETASVAQRIEQYLRKNYAEHITNQTLGGVFGYVPSYVSMLFRREYGVSPSEYLTGIRIEQAKRMLLENPNALIRDVALDVGLQEPAPLLAHLQKPRGRLAERLCTREEAGLMKRAVCLVFLCLALLLTGLSGCAPSAPVESAPSPTPQAEHYYALVVKDVTNPYMQRMFSGFAEACAAMGARAVLSGPEDASVEEQVACVRSLIHSGVEAIAIASNDRDALSPVLQEALAAGIKVISWIRTYGPRTGWYTYSRLRPRSSAGC